MSKTTLLGIVSAVAIAGGALTATSAQAGSSGPYATGYQATQISAKHHRHNKCWRWSQKHHHWRWVCRPRVYSRQYYPMPYGFYPAPQPYSYYYPYRYYQPFGGPTFSFSFGFGSGHHHWH